MVFNLIRGDTQQRSFLVLKEGGYLVSATEPAPRKRLRAPCVGRDDEARADRGGLGRIGRLLEEGTIRPDVATVYALEDAAQAWKTSRGTYQGFMGCRPVSPVWQDARCHGKIVFVWPRVRTKSGLAPTNFFSLAGTTWR